MNLSLKMKLRGAKSVVKARIWGGSYIWAQFFVTRRCNFKCDYCGVVDNSRADPPREWLQSWMDQAKATGCLGIALFGGEPFLRKDLEDIVADATERSLYTQLSTNLSLITKERLQHLSDNGLGELRFSIDSTKAWGQSTKTTCELDRKLDHLLTLRHRWKFNIAATFVLTPDNWQYIKQVLDYLEPYEIPLSIVPIEPKGITPSYELMGVKYEQTHERIEQIARDILRYKKEGYLIDVADEYIKQIPNYWVGKANWKCKAGEYTYTVDVDGRIGFCSSLNYFPFDNIILSNKRRKQRFRKISKRTKIWCTERCLSGCQFNTAHYATHWREFIHDYL